jgi:hypothetical protein
MITFEGGHVPPVDLVFQVITPFFDEVTGVVRK